MPVWKSQDKTLDIESKSGKQRRHISFSCPLYSALSTAAQSPVKGVPNTVKLQETTVRCEHTACKKLWDEIDDKKANPGKAKATGGTKSGATTPVKAVGGKSATLADKAKAARERPVAKVGA